MSCTAAFGLRGEAARAVRKAHSEKLMDESENMLAYFLVGQQLFHSPKARLITFKLQAKTSLFVYSRSIAPYFFAAFFLEESAFSPFSAGKTCHKGE
ncbi:MAG: hypothetical protein IJU12_04500 [Clostridia bacterium]|nr:hypothetical protein [Clostridia bacterium]